MIDFMESFSKQILKNVFLLVFAIIICGFPTVPIFAEHLKKFRIKNVQGRVLAWKPWSHVWSPLQSDEHVWEHTLIQVGRDSSFVFVLEAKEGFKGLKAETAEYTINVPMVLRLESGIPRTVKLDNYFIPKLPDISQVKGAKGKPLYHSFKEAWQRFAANILPQSVKKIFYKQATEEKVDTPVSVRARKIKMYTPADGAIAITERLPHHFRIAWRKASVKDLSYGIRVWEIEQARPTPLGFTKHDYYSVKINKEGTYLVQVATKDGRWQSDVRRFNVVLPMMGRGRPPSRISVIKPLPLELPPRNFIYLTDTFPISVTFVWGLANSAKGKQIYEFVLADAKKNPLFERNTDELSMTIKFNEPGRYKWFLTSYPQNVKDPELSQAIFSEVRSFSIEKFKPSLKGQYSQKSDPLKRMISTSSRRVFYLSEGF